MNRFYSKTKQSGFTIVELLIVIVVIGILAAIVLVAFNGIRTNAENTKTIQAVAQYVKAINIYATTKGQYPIVTGVYPCLGPHPGACGRVTAGASCLVYGGSSTNTDFEALIKEVMPSLPQLSTQRMNCGGVMYSGGFYSPSTGTTANIIYYLNGDQACQPMDGAQTITKQQQDDTTLCRVQMRPLS